MKKWHIALGIGITGLVVYYIFIRPKTRVIQYTQPKTKEQRIAELLQTTASGVQRVISAIPS